MLFRSEMKMKNKDLTQSYDSKRKSSLTLSFEFCFFTFYFLLFTFYFPASAAGAEISLEQLDPINLLVSRQNQQETRIGTNVTANFAAQDDGQKHSQLPQSGLLISKAPDTLLGRQLWQARISTSKGQKDNKSRNELQQIIKQIHSVEFKPQAQTPEAFIVVEPVQKTEPNENLSDIEATAKSEEKKVEPGTREAGADNLIPTKAGTISDQTLQMLDNLSQHPEQLENPFELAEVLFHSGHLKQAEKCYRQALSRSSRDETDSPGTRAWILFQIGNCLRNDDPAAAMETYRQLIAEHPNSLWVDLAKARSSLINWYQQNKPRMLIDENR